MAAAIGLCVVIQIMGILIARNPELYLWIMDLLGTPIAGPQNYHREAGILTLSGFTFGIPLLALLALAFYRTNPYSND